MTILINVDVPDLEAAIAFYTTAFGLGVGRRFGMGAAELTGWPAPLFLLRKEAGSTGAGKSRRTYERYWTPVHLDILVDKIEVALSRAEAAGAVVEQAVRTEAWGKIAVLADPFGHGLCLIEFLNRGYDEIADITNGGFCADPIVRFGELWGQLAKVGHLEQLAELAALGVRAD